MHFFFTNLLIAYLSICLSRLHVWVCASLSALMRACVYLRSQVLFLRVFLVRFPLDVSGTNKNGSGLGPSHKDIRPVGLLLSLASVKYDLALCCCSIFMKKILVCISTFRFMLLLFLSSMERYVLRGMQISCKNLIIGTVLY